MKAGAGDYLPKMGLKHDNIVAAVRERLAYEAARQARLHGQTTRLKSHADTTPRRKRRRRPPPDIAGYPIVRSIGEGGSADVYLARSESLDREVVLKVLRKVSSGHCSRHDWMRSSTRSLLAGRFIAFSTRWLACWNGISR